MKTQRRLSKQAQRIWLLLHKSEIGRPRGYPWGVEMSKNMKDEKEIRRAPDGRDIREVLTLRVRGGDRHADDESKRPTDPHKLARAILELLKDYPTEGWVNVESVGPTALLVVNTAFRIAREEAGKRLPSAMLVMTQWEYPATVGGRKTRGICTRIFPIPTRYAI